MESASDATAIIYTPDPDAAIAAARLRRLNRDELGPRMLILRFDGACEIGSFDLNGVTLAAVHQIVLDCLSGTGRMPEQGDAILASLRGDTL